jgi:single-stranded-DNA-specific exonuclease
MVQLLYSRGLTEPSQLETFIAADKRMMADPFLLPGMDRVVAKIYQSLLIGENIAVYGDFDADGITATAVLVQGLTVLGGKVVPYIPDRLTEGHGLRTAALANLSHQGIRLVITVDCGVTAVSQVEQAKRLGLDIIITDHHIPLSEIPPALAVVDPKLPGSAYPFSELAGVGVAFKLLQALFQGIGKEQQLDGWLDLVALGTVADMMPLLGENRYLVKQGLELINNAPRLGIRELMAQAGEKIGSLDSDRVSWVIAPRLNAVGRLEHAMSGYELLMAESPLEAQRLAVWLEQKNAERRKLTTDALAKAREQVLAKGISPLLMAGDRGYPGGIVGLVAGRLSEEFYRPAIVVRIGEKVSSGSCRSIPEFNITLALNQCRDLLSQFGGHSQAAGFTLPTENLIHLEQRMSQLAATQLEGFDLRPRIDIDAEVSLADIGGDTFQTTQQLAPFGCGNPVPTFLSRGVEVVDCRTMGGTGEHLRLKLKQGGVVWGGVAFRLGGYLAEVSSPLDIVYNLEIDHWGGAERLRLNIHDFAPTG